MVCEDPGNGKVWATAPDMGPDDVDNALETAHAAFEDYKKVNPRQRAQWMLKWDQLIRENRDDLAQIVTHECGKPLFESQGELDYALGFTWWFAGEAERVQGTVQVPAAPNRRVFTVKQPIGVAVALVPWNFPIAMILRKAGAALAAGCTMIVKPSPETPFSVGALAYLAEKAGFPKGVFSVMPTSLDGTPALSESLCRHPLTKKVTFTGSTRVGKLIAKICSDGLKKVTLELGGNCPFLVFDDADLEQAAARKSPVSHDLSVFADPPQSFSPSSGATPARLASRRTECTSRKASTRSSPTSSRRRRQRSKSATVQKKA